MYPTLDNRRYNLWTLSNVDLGGVFIKQEHEIHLSSLLHLLITNYLAFSLNDDHVDDWTSLHEW